LKIKINKNLKLSLLTNGSILLYDSSQNIDIRKALEKFLVATGRTIKMGDSSRPDHFVLEGKLDSIDILSFACWLKTNYKKLP
jgi:hypothetical protein